MSHPGESDLNPYLPLTWPASSNNNFMLLSVLSMPGLISGRSTFLLYRPCRPPWRLGISPTDSPQRPNRARYKEKFAV